MKINYVFVKYPLVKQFIASRGKIGLVITSFAQRDKGSM